MMEMWIALQSCGGGMCLRRWCSMEHHRLKRADHQAVSSLITGLDEQATPDDGAQQTQLATVVAGLAKFESEAGRLAEAESHWRWAIRLWPQRASCHNGLASTLGLQNRWEDASAELRRAIELEPNATHCHMALARALKRVGAVEAAASVVRRVLELDPNLASAQRLLHALSRE